MTVTFKITYESPVKNFPCKDFDTGTGRKLSMRHISIPLYIIKDSREKDPS